jgi:hypothetical protein
MTYPKKPSIVKLSFQREVISPSPFLIKVLEMYLLESMNVILLYLLRQKVKKGYTFPEKSLQLAQEASATPRKLSLTLHL